MYLGSNMTMLNASLKIDTCAAGLRGGVDLAWHSSRSEKRKAEQKMNRYYM